MYNAKEKAEELISKFEKIKDSLSPYGNSLLFDKEAIECALITVDEIIKELSTIHCYGENDIDDSIQWYQEVKQELEKL